MNSENPLGMLVGEELSEVCFVMDYVEFHFNGPVLRSISNPIIELAETKFEFPLPGAREALCAIIGRAVKQVEERKDKAIKVVFST